MGLGMDLLASLEGVILEPGDRRLIPTGFHSHPEGFEDKSDL